MGSPVNLMLYTSHAMTTYKWIYFQIIALVYIKEKLLQYVSVSDSSHSQG